MSQRFVPKKTTDTYVPNPTTLRQSVLELRPIYSEMSEMEYCFWYEKHFKVKAKEVKSILRGVENE